MSVKLGLITGRTSRVIAQEQHREPNLAPQAPKTALCHFRRIPDPGPAAGVGGGSPRRVLQRSMVHLQGVEQHAVLLRTSGPSMALTSVEPLNVYL